MKQTMKQWDILLGTVGAGASYWLSYYNAVITAIVATLTAILLTLRVMRALQRRNYRLVMGKDGTPITVEPVKQSRETSTI